MFSDPWLERWLPRILECAGGDSVFEIVCGYGDDTAVLARAGLSVVAFDLSPVCVAAARARVPSATIDCRDVRDPFPDAVRYFLAEHDTVFVVEQNRDAQMRTMLINELDVNPAKLVKVLHYDGTPITARFIIRSIHESVAKSAQAHEAKETV